MRMWDARGSRWPTVCKTKATMRYQKVHFAGLKISKEARRCHHRQTPLAPGARLPLTEELLTTRMGARFNVPAAGRSSPAVATVVRRAAPFMMGAERGLRTLGFHSPSWLFFTMRRAALAEMLFSFGGLEDVLLGLRCRCVLLAGKGLVVEERRLMAVRIWFASVGSTDQPSSVAELLSLSFAEGDSSDARTPLLKTEGRTVFVPISRRGEVSESDP